MLETVHHQTSCFHYQIQFPQVSTDQQHGFFNSGIALTSSEKELHQDPPSITLADSIRACRATSDETPPVEILVERHCET